MCRLILLLCSCIVVASQNNSGPIVGCNMVKYDAFLQAEGKEIFIKSSLCESNIKLLKTRLAGLHGPVLQEDMEKVLCSSDCLESDLLHQLAMSKSGCSCSELSSKNHIEKDFCRQNSARMLCLNLGVCGTWNCELSDYMCPRHDWNSLYRCGTGGVKPSSILIIINVVIILLKTEFS